MSGNAQLAGISYAAAKAKADTDRGLTLRELAVVTEMPYSTVRQWPEAGLPMLGGRVFYSDFVEWRRLQTGLVTLQAATAAKSASRSRGGRSPRSADKSGGSAESHD